MKIDIHTHTKKCKSGDAPSREISPTDFCDAVLSTDVKIVAITNHNAFDLAQYNEIKTKLTTNVQVWPGIELDIREEHSRGHLLVIVSPLVASEFSDQVCELIQNVTPDNFSATIDEILQTFDSLNPLYIAHYKQKKPNLSDAAIDQLLRETAHPSRVIKEVANAISAGIYISHGHASIYGSDVHDWKTYESLARQLPDLRLPVDSFEHFCLLLEKDQTTINTLLDQKVPEKLILLPFEDGSILTIKTFNDINVIFGPKGTGKTCILKAIAKYYCENGVDAKVYESGVEHLHDVFDLKGRELAINLNEYNIDSCMEQIEALRNAKELGITSLNAYVTYFEIKATNKNAKKIVIKEVEPEEESGPKREFLEFNDAAEKTREFLTYLTSSPAFAKALNKKQLDGLLETLETLLERIDSERWTSFSKWKETYLLNSAIRKFSQEVARKTGTPPKPMTPGFRDYAINRVKIRDSAAKIIHNSEKSLPTQTQQVGNLGSKKGELELRTEFQFQTAFVTDSTFLSLSGTKKSVQKSFMSHVREIFNHAFSDTLFRQITEMNEIEDSAVIKTLNNLLLFKRYFALSGQHYAPSSGEASMVMLQKELQTNKDIYILDEPEKSLGNEYISDVIVPLIKEQARLGKRIFISTHDANIAVRTLPYSSIYRYHGPDGYKTYIGNPFSNNLTNSEDENDRLDWKIISMRTLEGGEDAFGERGKIYGNN